MAAQNVFLTNLAIDDDWAVHVGSNEGSAKGIEIRFKGGSGIANGDAVVSEAGEFLLETLMVSKKRKPMPSNPSLV